MPHSKSDITIRLANEDDIQPVLSLLEQELGQNWIYAKHLKAAIADDLLYIADDQGEMAGYVLLRMFKKGGFVKELKGQPYDMPQDLRIADEHETIGFIEAVTTSPAHRGKGAATKLISAAETALKQAGATVITALGWKPEKVNIGPILYAAGFQDRAEFDNLWYKETSKEDAADCPGCGKPPCECGAVLFSKSV